MGLVGVPVESVAIQAAPFGTTPPQTEQRRRRRRGGRRRRPSAGPQGTSSSTPPVRPRIHRKRTSQRVETAGPERAIILRHELESARVRLDGGVDGVGCRPVRPGACTGSAAGAESAGSAHLPRADRRCHDGRHREGRSRAIHRGPEERRLRNLRGRREAGDRVDDDEPWRPRHQRARSSAPPGARRGHSAAHPPSQRHIGAHIPFLRGRHAPAVPGDAARSGSVPEDFEDASPRRRHVRHRLERPFVDRDRHDVRQEAHGRRDQEDDRCGAQAQRDHRGGVRTGRAFRASLSRARRVCDDDRGTQQPREGARSTQGARVGQRRIRFQSVPECAAGVRRSEFAVPAESTAADDESTGIARTP